MEFNALGNSGLKISRLAFGSWLTFERGGVENAREMVDIALGSGINMLDTADVYDCGVAEEFLGGILRGRRRQHLVIASKVYFPMSDDVNDCGLSRKHIMESIDNSLRRLGTDYLDLYQCHRWDGNVPLEETVRAMGDLIRNGKVLYWGTSCWSAKQIRRAVAVAKELGVPAPISEQPPYNMVSRQIEEEVMPTCRELGIGLLNWSPLAQGFLSGKYQFKHNRPEQSRGAENPLPGGFLDRLLDDGEAFRTLGRLEEIAEDHHMPLPVLALAWCLRRPEIGAVLVGASTPEQLRTNLAAIEVDWTDQLDQACEDALNLAHGSAPC
jgi:aryl-alcohol dehydrogenase-like predicted oxidoreductase